MNEQPPPPDPTAAPSPYGPPAHDPANPYQQPYGAPEQPPAFAPPASAPPAFWAPGPPPASGPPAYGVPGQSGYGTPDAYGVPGQPAYGAPGQPAYGAPGQPVYGAPDGYGVPGQAYGAPGAYGVPGQPGYGVPGAGGAYPPPGAPGHPYAPGGFGAPGYPYGNPVPAKTNGFAVAALVLGVLAVIPFAVISGIVALVQIGKSGDRGRGLAIGGLVAAGLWLLLACGLGVIGVIAEESAADSRPGYAGPGPVDIPVQMLGAGNCVNGVAAMAGVVDELPVVPCTEPHEGEVFATFTLTGGPWPGDEFILSRAEAGCDTRYEQYTSRVDTSIEIIFLTPGESSWSTDRGVTCIATSADGPRTGSLRD